MEEPKMSKNKLFKRKCFCSIFIVLLIAFNTQITFAGSLNENEAAIISAAQGTFEYKGIQYQTDPVFIQQLRSYLSQDDVDLNASQKDEAISMMFSNIEQGVAEGYLIPLGGQEDQTKNGDQGDNKDQGEKPNRTTDKSTSHGENTDITGDSSSTETSGNNKNEDNPDQGIINEIRKQPATKTEVDQNKNRVTVKTEDNSSVVVVNTVIKNTGFNLNSALTVSAGLIIVFMICLIITVKYNFFRQEEQE